MIGLSWIGLDDKVILCHLNQSNMYLNASMRNKRQAVN